MNCSRFRFLIQQRFDVDLSPSDEQGLFEHLKQCESCSKFHYQIEQVINAASDIDLPEECLPSNHGLLARTIMEQLPPPKTGFWGWISGLFPRPATNKSADKSTSFFPHVKRTALDDLKHYDEQAASSARLKALRLQDRNEQSTSSTQNKSLGLKSQFGLGPSPEQIEAEELSRKPYNLAQSIKQQVEADRTKQETAASTESSPATPSPVHPTAAAKPLDLTADFTRQSSSANTISQSDVPTLPINVEPIVATPVNQWTSPSLPAPAFDSWQESWDEPPVETGFVKDDWTPPPGSDWGNPSMDWSPPASTNTAAPEIAALDRFESSIQERVQSASTADSITLPASTPAAGLPVDSIMNRLSHVLQDEGTESVPTSKQPAPSHDSRWEKSIAEKMQSPITVPPTTNAEPVPLQKVETPSDSGLFKGLSDEAMNQLFNTNLNLRDSDRAIQLPTAQASGNPSVTPPLVTPPPFAPTDTLPTTSPAPVSSTPVASSTKPVAESGLLKTIDDQAMDQLFSSNLGISESILSLTPPKPETPPVPPASTSIVELPPELPPAALHQEAVPITPTIDNNKVSLPSVDDKGIDKIFSDNLGIASSASPHINVSQAVQSIRDSVGKPAMSAALAPKVDGLGRLSNTETNPEEGVGKIASIGKFLLDQQDLAKIGRLSQSELSDTKLRILTVEAAGELQELLTHISKQPGVLGSVIVGHDGLLIANNMPSTIEPESVGIWALGAYLNTDNVVKKMGHQHVQQIVAATSTGYLIVADFGGGILVTLTQNRETNQLIPLMRNITQLVAG